MENAKSTSDQEGANIIYKNAKDLQKILDQLIELNNSNFKASQYKLMEEDITPYMNNWLSKYNTWAREKEIELKIDGPRELRTVFDESKFQSIVSNLVDNAIKYTPQKGIVSIHYKMAGEIFSLSVEDSGIGINSKFRDKVFERFFRIGDADAQGTGIGLSIVREYVDQMGGEIQLSESSLGGCKFTFSVNISYLKGEIPKNRLTASSIHPILKPSKPQILIVEDHDDLRNFLVTSLNKNYDCIPAMNGNIGYELAKKNSPDLIITDLMMPEMTGEELAQKIRNSEYLSHIPILVLSAKSRTLDKIELYKIGADNYLQKPFEIEELRVIVDNLLEQRKRLRESFRSNVFESTDTDLEINEYLEDSFMIELCEIIDENLSDSKFTMVALCKEMRVGRNQLQKKVKALTNMTPVEFVRSYRIKKAMEILQKGELTVSETAYKVGFNHLSYFTKMFKKQFGVLPSNVSDAQEAISK